MEALAGDLSDRHLKKATAMHHCETSPIPLEQHPSPGSPALTIHHTTSNFDMQ